MLFSFIFFAGLLHAGAVIRIDRIDLINGKKIILFSELHIGPITPHISSEDLARRQSRIFNELFNTFIPNKNNYAMYIENSLPVKETNLEYYRKTEMTNLPGFATSWFDRFYLSDTHGPEANWEFFDYSKNFDERVKVDWLFAGNLSPGFDRFYEEYRKGGFNEEYFQSFKKKFFESDKYKQFQELSKDYAQLFLTRLDVLKKRLEPKLSVQDFARLNALIESRIRMYSVYLNALQKAHFMNKNYFEFLFDLAHIFKADFYRNLSEILNLNETITAVANIAHFNAVIADLSLLYTLLTDQHPVILVSLGTNHSKFIMDFFSGSPMTRSATFLDMLHPGMTHNLDIVSPAVINFVKQQ